MNTGYYLSKSRGSKNLLLRIIAILCRFGITHKKFQRSLQRYAAVTRNGGSVPTFAITAVVLKRNPELIRELNRQGIEFAVHGYIHTDYRPIPLEEQVRHFKNAIDIFNGCQVSFTGFRAPFLRINGRTPKVLGSLGFLYDSSHILCWDVLDSTQYPKQAWHEYSRLLDFYMPLKAEEYLTLPKFINGFVEIPVSIPDDEAIIDRLGITDEKEISKIWLDILQRTYNRGELFTVQLHPERISFCENALSDILEQAKRLNPSVWVATLREITEWWREREKFTLEIDSRSDRKYYVKAACSERATILLKNCEADAPSTEWANGYRSIIARDFTLESPVRPVIGVSSDSSPAAVKFLRTEGFVVEQSDQPDHYGLYLDDLTRFEEADEKPLSEKVEQSEAPLLRYWRWPDQARSALSITGDIDSMTIADFALRIFENWRQSRR
ncbi:MAG: polysaccharide deacetylase family protein [Dehalococcoidales bacterium]|nr:MAG: polysaccharide deacetylase family protein [Dehalococcoidales bacterium]